MIKFTVKSIEFNKVLLSVLSRLDTLEAGAISISKEELYADWKPSKKAGEQILDAAPLLGELALTLSNVNGDFGDECFSVVRDYGLFISVKSEEQGFVFVLEPDVLTPLINVSSFLFHHYTLEELRGMKSKYTLNMVLNCLDNMVLKRKVRMSFRQIGYLCGLDSDKCEDRLFYRNVVQSCFADFSRLTKAPIAHKTLTKTNPITNRPQNFALKLESAWLGCVM